MEHTKLLAGQGREAPAIVRIDDTYFMLSSACSGWDPNQCKLSYSKSLTSGWSSLTGLNNKWSYDTQAASILTVRGREGVSYLYVGDRWQDPGLAESKTIIFPLEFSGNTCSFKYRQQFDLDFATGKWKDTTPTNRVPKGEWKLREATASQNGHEAAKAFDNNLDTYWHTKWDSPKPVLPYSIEIDMGKSIKYPVFFVLRDWIMIRMVRFASLCCTSARMETFGSVWQVEVGCHIMLKYISPPLRHVIFVWYHCLAIMHLSLS